tara:strand:- start:466 stop:2409 length:1944 start_codon:yes stop_codon:yes gene_type:complete
VKRYTLSVTSPEYWSEIHEALIVDSNQDGIPDRKVTCSNSKSFSPTRSTYELTEEEAAEIAKHPKVQWIELSPEDNPDHYPNPSPASKRYLSNVKIYRDLGTHGPSASNPPLSDLNRTNWAMKRVGIDTNGDFYGTSVGNIASVNGNLDYSLTGKNIDIIIQDSGILASHPEFLDGTGKSRVRDIVLDGPYYIDKSYFDTNNHTFTRPDGRVGITTTSAIAWWENNSSRSATFQSYGTVNIPSGYTEAKAMGVGIGTVHSITSGHGTACASLAAGKNFGLAFEANIWNMPGIGDAVNLTPITNYELMNLFNILKPVNSETGVKNPTVINGSWGYQAAFSIANTVSYKFRGSTGTFLGGASVTDQVTAMKHGLNNQVTGAFRSWSSSSRSNSTDTAGNEMMTGGNIHYVAAAGNNNQRLGVGADDPDRLNYMSDNYYGTTDPRSEFPSGTVPCNHRDWMTPQGLGFIEAADPNFHPTICVGAMDDEVNVDLSERKASYSNNGPGIDVWAPADETLAAGLTGQASYEDFQRRDNNVFFDANFNGTSAAAPVVTGLVALYLQGNPTATQRQVKNFIGTKGSVLVENSLYQDQYSNDSTTTYWTGSFNLRGASRRIARDLSATNVKPTIKGGFTGTNHLRMTGTNLSIKHK